MLSQRHTRGFSLVEMALVLVLMGAVLGGLVPALASLREQARISETRRLLAEAREALIGFALIHGVLPHPDTDGDGREEAATVEGALPWATLGLDRAAGLDAWGNPLRYRADPAFLTPPGALPATVDGLQLRDADGALSAGDPDGFAAVLLAVGGDRQGNGENGDGDALYLRGDYCVTGCVVPFDDLLEPLSKHLLIGRLAAAGRWP